MTNRKVTLYVKSVKTAIGTEKIGHREFVGGPSAKCGGYRAIPTYKVNSITRYNFVLPEDQERVVEIVRKIAPGYGFDIEIVDVTKENIIHRVLRKEVRKIKTFPTLISDSGEKIEGNITKEQVEFLLRKTV